MKSFLEQGTRAAKRIAPAACEAKDLGNGCWVKYAPRAFPPDVEAQLFKSLQTDIDWQERPVVVMGRRVLQPRLVAYQASSPAFSYTYSRVTVVPEAWHPTVESIKVRWTSAAKNRLEFEVCRQVAASE